MTEPQQPALAPGCQPKRPDRDDPRVLELAADNLTPRIIRWVEATDGELPESERQLAPSTMYRRHVKDVLERASFGDSGYQLAKHMEDEWDYSPNDELVEILADADHELWAAHQQIQKNWVADHGITVPFTVGQAVRTVTPDHEGNAAQVDGTITRIYAETATVCVNCPSLGHKAPGDKSPGTYGVIKNIEDVEAI